MSSDADAAPARMAAGKRRAARLPAAADSNPHGWGLVLEQDGDEAPSDGTESAPVEAQQGAGGAA